MTGINETVAIAIGSAHYTGKATYFYNLLNNAWTTGPTLLVKRNVPGKKRWCLIFNQYLDIEVNEGHIKSTSIAEHWWHQRHFS